MNEFTITHTTRKTAEELIPLFTTKAGLESWICYRCEATLIEETDGIFCLAVGQDHYFDLKVVETQSNRIVYEQTYMDDIKCAIEVVIKEASAYTVIQATFSGKMHDTRFLGTLEKDYRMDWTLDEIE